MFLATSQLRPEVIVVHVCFCDSCYYNRILLGRVGFNTIANITRHSRAAATIFFAAIGHRDVSFMITFSAPLLMMMTESPPPRVVTIANSLVKVVPLAGLLDLPGSYVLSLRRFRRPHSLEQTKAQDSHGNILTSTLRCWTEILVVVAGSSEMYLVLPFCSPTGMTLSETNIPVLDLWVDLVKSQELITTYLLGSTARKVSPYN